MESNFHKGMMVVLAVINVTSLLYISIFKSVKSMSSAQFSNCTGKNGSEDALSVCHALNHKLTSKVFNWSTAPI